MRFILLLGLALCSGLFPPAAHADQPPSFRLAQATETAEPVQPERPQPEAERKPLEPISIPLDVDAIDLLPRVQRFEASGDSVSIQTAPGRDGIVRRIEVRSREVSSQAGWIAFALRNDTSEQIERLLVAPHFRLAGSGVIWPDLGTQRITAISVSQGDRPERQQVQGADAFLITLDPGAIVTFVAELRASRLPQLELWEPDAYKENLNSLTLYRGIVLGISALLAVFLTIIFVVRGAVIFPAAAAIAWAVLAYLGIDFGFWGKLFVIAPRADRIYRASAEAVLAATLLTFLFAYLNLNRWHVRYSHFTVVWLLILASIIGLAVFNAPVAAGVARIMVAAVATFGLLLVVFLSIRGYDRAVMLIPTWFLLFAWVGAAGLLVTGRIRSEIAVPALFGGLVLIVMLIGFTVIQHAFAGSSLSTGQAPETERKALALTGADELVFDWDVVGDKIYVSPECEHSLGLKVGALDGPAVSWLGIIHPSDRDRYRATLDTVLEQRRGKIHLDFRMRTADAHYLWFNLKARPVVGADGEVFRVVGTLTDVTEAKIAEDRLLHDAVHDHLTGLPNSQLFIDRLENCLSLARQNEYLRPTIIAIDLDRFKNVNDTLGHATGDSILLTVARRLARLLKPQDTLARFGGDSYGIIMVSETDAQHIVSFADMIRRSITTPIAIADREVFLTASIGILLHNAQNDIKASDCLKNAEIAVTHAKRLGGDRIEVFKPAMRSQRHDRFALEADLRQALDRDEIKVLFQPIVRLEDRTIAGFEALLRWDHPEHGKLAHGDFAAVAEETGLVVDLVLFMLERTARELADWQRALDVDPPIFASVNIASRQLLRHDLLHDVKTILSRTNVKPGSLKLEMSENLVMEDPEYAAQILTRIRDLGAGLSLDDFGAGYSSLAYLQRFPFDTIKIDQAFVRHDAKGARPLILRTMISLAHDLGMTVVAEGAESESDAVELYHFGCEYAQGYAFGEPMTVMQARSLISGGVTSEAA
ncbi:MAG: EAL domain-containing protein [Beijerinckiaceae bacterium]|nr:EAL domain-containing protein [Beijerinckiaceae bacterium]